MCSLFASKLFGVLPDDFQIYRYCWGASVTLDPIHATSACDTGFLYSRVQSRRLAKNSFVATYPKAHWQPRHAVNLPLKIKGGSTASRLICLYGCYVDVLAFGFFYKQILITVIQSFALHAVHFTTKINAIRARLLIIHDSKLLSEKLFSLRTGIIIARQIKSLSAL